jgi:hypothetical protein
MTQVERMLHEAHLRYQREQLRPKPQAETAVCPLPAAEIRGCSFAEPQSATWYRQHRVFRPAGYYRIHCSHDRLLWDTCTTCKRNKREADRNFGKMARGDRF